MAWIEFHGAKIKRLKKFTDMKRELRLSTNEALGLLGSFWSEVIELSEDGDISKWSPEYLCDLTETKLNPERVWQTLVRTGWIDMTEDGLYLVHDWMDTAGRFLEIKYKNYPDKLKAIQAKHHKSRIEIVREPLEPPKGLYLTKPDQPNQPTKKGVGTPTPTQGFVESFGEIYTGLCHQPFKYDKKHFIIVSKLIKDHGLETLQAKAKILAAMCVQGEVWFCKNGAADFRIETLSAQWNSIIPQERMSEAQIKDLKFQEALRIEGKKSELFKTNAQ